MKFFSRQRLYTNFVQFNLSPEIVRDVTCLYIYRMDEEKFLQTNSGAGITFLIPQKDAFL